MWIAQQICPQPPHQDWPPGNTGPSHLCEVSGVPTSQGKPSLTKWQRASEETQEKWGTPMFPNYKDSLSSSHTGAAALKGWPADA